MLLLGSVLAVGPAAAQTPASPPEIRVTADDSGLGVRTSDNRFSFRLRGDAQLDGRFFADDTAAVGVNTFYLRRVRFSLQGTLYGMWDFRIMPNFGQGRAEIQDAYVEGRFHPSFNVIAGKYKVPLGLEWLRSPTDLTFVELAYPIAVVPNRDVGVSVRGEVVKERLNYEVGLFNGATDGVSEDQESAGDGKDVSAKLFAHPFKGTGVTALEGLGVGFGATYGTQEGTPAASALGQYRTQGRRTAFRYRAGSAATTPTAQNTVVADGERLRWSPQGYFYYGPLSLLGEYVQSVQTVRLDAQSADLTTKAWAATAGFLLTGEKAGYRRLKPAQPMATGSQGVGAFEVALRVHGYDFDNDAFPIYADPARSATAALGYGVGLNWYPNANVRVMLNLERTDFETPPGGTALPPENLVLTRFQVGF